MGKLRMYVSRELAPSLHGRCCCREEYNRLEQAPRILVVRRVGSSGLLRLVMMWTACGLLLDPWVVLAAPRDHEAGIWRSSRRLGEAVSGPAAATASAACWEQLWVMSAQTPVVS